jgi:HlyD family secretion protein
MVKLRWIIAIVVLAAAVAGVIAYGRAHRQTGPKYLTTAVDRGRIVARVTATGTLSALVTVQVGAQVSGRIAQINVDFNSPVKKGELIAKIDPQIYAAAVEQAKANLIAAQGQLVKAQAQSKDAERQFTRSNQLRTDKLVAQADLDTAEANMEAAKAQVTANQGAVEQAKASLHQAIVNLDYTTIISPINGVVISRNVDVGQTVAAALQAPTLFTIAEDLKKMQVDTNVAEADVGKLTPGMDATFTVDAYPSERFKGKVRQIRNAPQTVQNVVTYDAVIDVDNSALKLKPGMTSNVTFVYAEKDDVLRVPNAALRWKPPADLMAKLDPTASPKGKGHRANKGDPTTADKRNLWVLRGENPVMVPIRVGVSDGSLSEIAEGEIKEGDLAVTDQMDAKGGSSSSQRPPSFGRGF